VGGGEAPRQIVMRLANDVAKHLAPERELLHQLMLSASVSPLDITYLGTLAPARQ
jgi:hypothetical protein